MGCLALVFLLVVPFLPHPTNFWDLQLKRWNLNKCMYMYALSSYFCSKIEVGIYWGFLSGKLLEENLCFNISWSWLKKISSRQLETLRQQLNIQLTFMMYGLTLRGGGGLLLWLQCTMLNYWKAPQIEIMYIPEHSSSYWIVHHQGHTI